MFQRAPELPTPENAFIDQTPPQLSEKQQARLARKIERYARRRARLPLKFAALAIATSNVASAYWNDVEANRAVESQNEISIDVIRPALDPENENKATVVIDGFNAYDATYLSDKLGPSIQRVADGEIWSLNYNNAILDRDEIYAQIVDLAEERGIESISISGYSMGGIIGVEAAADIVEKTDLPVNALIFVSTPDGYDGLRPYQRNELAFGQLMADALPGSEYSSWVRYAGEVYFYRDAYTGGEFSWDMLHNANLIAKNIGKFFDTLDTIAERSNDPRQTSIRLLTQQIYKIAKVDIRKEFQTIQAQSDTKQMPSVLYLGTGEPGYDHVVNDKVSAENICAYSMETDLACEAYQVEGAIHSQYYQTLEAYDATFSEAAPLVHDEVATQIAITAMKQSERLLPFQAQGTPPTQ